MENPVRQLQASPATTSLFKPQPHYARVWLLMLTLTAMAALFATNAGAATSAENTVATAPAPAAPSAPSTPPAPKYAAQDVERAFGFIDANHDGKISREEAIRFKNVTKYFDAADLNKDNFLSPSEFDNALNGSRPQ
jgi:EF hand